MSDTWVAGPNTPAASIRDALKGSARVLVQGEQAWEPGVIVVPPHKILCAQSRVWLHRKSGGEGPLVTVDSDGSFGGDGFGRFLMRSNGYAGTGVLFPGATSRQQVAGLVFEDYLGVCLDLTAAEAGHECNVTGVQAQRSNRDEPGIVLPEDEAGTRGIRRFEDCQGGGGRLIAVRGANVTLLDECSTLGDLLMSDRARQIVVEKCRLAVPNTGPWSGFVIRGQNHIVMQNQISSPVFVYGSGCLIANYDAGRYLMPGVSGNVILRMGQTPATVDWSGTSLNATLNG
jgi:hypothetical protein